MSFIYLERKNAKPLQNTKDYILRFPMRYTWSPHFMCLKNTPMVFPEVLFTIHFSPILAIILFLKGLFGVQGQETYFSNVYFNRVDSNLCICLSQAMFSSSANWNIFLQQKYKLKSFANITDWACHEVLANLLRYRINNNEPSRLLCRTQVIYIWIDSILPNALLLRTKVWFDKA